MQNLNINKNLIDDFQNIKKLTKSQQNDILKTLDIKNSIKTKNKTDNFKIVTCLVLGTRMYNGYTNGEHHVRSFYELLNFLDTGKIEITDNEVTKEISLWKNNKITGDDIYDFIENMIIHKPMFESFSIQKNKEFIGKYSVSFETFEFDEKKFYENLKVFS
jgi:hypothetical protein